MAKESSYRTKRCPRCKKLIPINGAAWSSHMRSHERRAKQKQKKKKKEVHVNLQEYPYAMVGDDPPGDIAVRLFGEAHGPLEHLDGILRLLVGPQVVVKQEP